MNIKAYILIVLALALPAAPIWAKPRPGSGEYDEYQVKAAFLYNFTKLTEWPKEKLADNNATLNIGVIGKSPFGNNLDYIKGEKAKDKKIAIRHFESFKLLAKSNKKQNLENLRKCHLLFICSSEKNNLKKILSSVGNSNVLTVGDMDGFLEAGGMLNLITAGEKVSFEINVDAVNRAGLKLSSKLIRVAKRVVKVKSSAGTKG